AACDNPSQADRKHDRRVNYWMIIGCRPPARRDSAPMWAPTWGFVVRPLGFGPRTCGLRVALRPVLRVRCVQKIPGQKRFSFPKCPSENPTYRLVRPIWWDVWWDVFGVVRCVQRAVTA